MTIRAHAAHRITNETLGASSLRAFSALEEFVLSRRKENAMTGFLEFEKELHARVMGLERELVKEELERADVDVPAIVIEGTVYRRVLRSEAEYQTAAGKVSVQRTLYKDRTDEPSRSVVPLELRVGLIEGLWTPLAAQEAIWVVAQMTPKLGEELFERVGNMSPSRNSLDRLPKKMLERWETQREEFEDAVRMTELVPGVSTTVAVSLDGVMAPMKDGEAVEKRAQTAAAGKLTKGPAGHREVGCGTVSFYDREGEMLRAVRIGRMPEAGKNTLKSTLEAELGHALAARPDLRVVGVADGARDNWTFLETTLAKVSNSTCVLDFFHAAEHMNAAFGAAYGEGSVQARATFSKWKTILLDDPRGVEKLIRAISHLRDRNPRSKVLAQTLG